MSTSGSYDLTTTRNAIIARAARQTGAIRAGETMGSQEVTDFSEALNAMVKRWSATPGMHVWTKREATLFPQVEQASYAIATSGADHCTASYVAMTLSAAAASGATSLSIASTTGVTVADYLGIILDDGTVQWTTVSAKTSTTITPTTALTGAASSGNAVYTYTTKLVRPLGIAKHEGAIRRYNIASSFETPIGPGIARGDYYSLPNKAQTGTINQLFYDPQLGTGYIYLWNPPSTVRDLVKFTALLPIMDFDSAADNPDFPQEWYDPLVWNLALEMAVEYDVPPQRYAIIQSNAERFLDDVGGFDREAESLMAQPDLGP